MSRHRLSEYDKLLRKKISHNLKVHAKGITQAKLSDITGIAPSTLSGYFNGTSTPDPGNVQKLADALNVSKEMLDPRFLEFKAKETSLSVRIPILGKVVAGIPIEAVEDILGYEEITEHLSTTGEFFALRVNGDSMFPNICDGDTVIVKKQTSVNSGDIAIVLINGNEATCKKIKITDNGITLIGYNLSVYEPHFYTNEEIASMPVSVIGKVVELRRKF